MRESGHAGLAYQSNGRQGGLMSIAPQLFDPSQQASSVQTAVASGPRSLDDLASMKPDELAELYRTASTPSVPALNGDLTGRMLAIPALPSWLGGLLRRFAAWRQFPW